MERVITNSTVQTAPLSKFQEQFWMLNKLAPKSAAYNIPAVFRLDSEPNIKVLEQAINQIIAKHEILRTHFSFTRNGFQQVINPEYECLVKVGVTDIPKEYNQATTEEILEVIHEPFELEKAPLLRVTVFKFNNAYILILVFHHIVIDLHSKYIFEKELNQNYSAILNNTQSVERHIPIKQYQDFSTWHNNWINEPRAQRFIDQWLDELPSINSQLELPTDKPRPSKNSQTGERIYFEIPEAISLQIGKYAARNNTKPYVVLLSCYAVFLHKIANQNQVIIGVPLSNRKQEEYADTFGVFVNTLPFAFDFTHLKSFAEVIKQVRQKMILAHRKQEIPFSTIVGQSKENRNISINHYYQVGYTFEPPMHLVLEGLTAQSIPIERKGAQLDMFLTLWEDKSIIKAYWEYSTELFYEKTIRQHIEYYLNIAKSLTATDDALLTI